MNKIFSILFIAVLLFCAKADAATPEREEMEWSIKDFCSAIGFPNIDDCLNLKDVMKFKCEDIRPVPNFWKRGLKPSEPMAICKYPRDTIEGVKLEGCMIASPLALLVAKRSKDRTLPFIIKTKAEFAKEFMPIEDKEEAISYASVLVNAEPMYTFPKDYYQFSKKDAGKWLVNKPKPTTADFKDDGWHVWLYYEPFCGCHPFELYMAEYLINNVGTVKKIDEKKVWSGGGEICVD